MFGASARAAAGGGPRSVGLSSDARREWLTPVLAPGDVHIWSASLDALRAADATLMTTLSSEEVERAQAFVFAADRRRFLSSHFLLRHLLAGYLGSQPRTISFTSGTFGKPQLPGDLSFDFNMSHSADVAVFVFGRDRHVGIDVERIRTNLDIEGLAARYFTPAEAQTIAQTSPAAKAAMFFALWVRKEAILKASGYGLRMPLDALDVAGTEHGAPPVVLQPSRRASEWLCLDILARAGYRAAAAFDQTPRRMSTWDLTGSTLDALADVGRPT